MKKKKLGIFLYNRLFDPVVQSNFWLYILDMIENDTSTTWEIYVITFENELIPLTTEQQKQVAYWQSKGVVWIQLKWHPGIKLISKAKDILQGFFAVLKLRLNGYKHFVSFTSIAGSFLYLYSLLLPFEFYLTSYEPHSEFAFDSGIWKPNSLQFKITHYLEKRAALAAKIISSGTHFMQSRLVNDWKVKASYFRIPTVVNDQKFLFNESYRNEVRQQLGIREETRLLFYTGKFGGLYYREEIAFMYKWLRELDKSLHLLIVTPHTNKEVIDIFNVAAIDQKDYTIAHSDYMDIHCYYSAADFGIISVPPGPSRKFLSPIKVGEYLCAGLPYLITEGVSEDYLFAIERQVGVVVKGFDEAEIKKAYIQIDEFLSMDKEVLRSRCRQAGIEYRGFDKLNDIFRQALSCLYQ